MAAAASGKHGIRICGSVMAAALALTGCGAADEPEQPEPPGAPLRAVAADLAGTTMRASYSAGISSLPSATLDGDGEVVAGSAMALGFHYLPDAILDEAGGIEGDLLVADGDAFLRSPQYDPPADREWFSVARNPAGTLDEAQQGDWYVLALSPLIDPMFLLGQGMPELLGVASTPDTVDGVAATEYTGRWFLDVDGAGPELSDWASGVVGASVLDFSLWVGDEGLPVRLRVSSVAQFGQFTIDTTYQDHGAELAVTAPPDDQVVAD